MITIKELADELNVSKTTIRNNLPKGMSFSKIGNKNYINDELKRAIIEQMNAQNKEFQHSSDKHTNNDNHRQIERELAFLRQQVDKKDEQLRIKDSQIEELSKLLKNQQILTLKSNERVENLETQINQIDYENNQLQEANERHTETSFSNDIKGLFNKMVGKFNRK